MDIVKQVISNFNKSLSPRILLYFRTLPFDKLVQRAAEEKHKEFFISEVIGSNIFFKTCLYTK